MSSAATPTRPRRLRWQPRQVVLLTVVWLVLVGDVSLVTVLGGLLLAWLVTVVFPMPSIQLEGNLRPWGTLVLLAHLVRDLAVASVRLAAYAFSTKVPEPGIVRIDLRSDDDLHQVITAAWVSVVPGTIVVDARRSTRRLYLHVFDMHDPAMGAQVVEETLALERRVVDALGSRRQREAVRTQASGEGER